MAASKLRFESIYIVTFNPNNYIIQAGQKNVPQFSLRKTNSEE